MENVYNTTGMPVDSIISCVCSVMTCVRQSAVSMMIIIHLLHGPADAEKRAKFDHN